MKVQDKQKAGLRAVIVKLKLKPLSVKEINGLPLPQLIETVYSLGVSKVVIAEAAGVAWSTVYNAAREGERKDITEAVIRQGILKLKKDGR